MGTETQKKIILQKLKEAGPKGLSKSELRITKGSEQAFQKLLRDKEIRNLGSKAKTRYVLKEYYNPLERAYDEIEKFAVMPGKRHELIPFTLTNIRSNLTPGPIREKAGEAIEFLIKEKRLLKLKIGRGTYFLHISSIAPFLPSKTYSGTKYEDSTSRSGISPDIIMTSGNVCPAHVEIDRNNVLESYEKIKRQKGFSNIEIYELQQALNAPMEKLKAFLLEESRVGRAVFSLGDWSLSSEETRSGAVYLDGKPYLLIRFV